MSNLWLNIRFGQYHLQIGHNSWWHTTISKNPYHKDNPKKFEIYTLPWIK